jgi:hypothetical protein
MPETIFHLPTLRTQEDVDAVMFELQDLPCVAQAEVDQHYSLHYSLRHVD